MAVTEHNDIDKFLDTIMSEDDSDESSENNIIIIEKKIYKGQKKQASKINMPYKSPVIKSGSILFNPESDTYSSKKRIVVRSLNNYVKYINRNNKSKIKYLSENLQF